MIIQVVVEQIPAPPAPPMPPFDPPWATLDPHQIMVLAVIGIIAAVIVLLPMLVAIARRVERGGSAGELRELRAEVESLRGHLAELTDDRSRVAELEERVDFAERLLAQQREPVRVPGGRPE